MLDLKSKSIKLRLIEESDAEFVLSLRLDDKYNKFLSSVNDDLQQQIDWIKKYKEDEIAGNQYYFIIETKDGTKCGTVRIYDLREDSFCWGSWILNNNKTRYAAIESALLVYRFGFDFLNFKKSHFDVIKENTKVVNFHKKFGAVKTGENQSHYLFEISNEAVNNMKEKFASLI